MARVDFADLSKIIAERFRDELLKQVDRIPPSEFFGWIVVEAD